MTRAQWVPWADTRAQRFDGVNPGGIMPSVGKVLWHTTEGTGWPGYSGGASAPTLTVKADFDRRAVEWRQHFPLNMSARALKDRPGGVRTNRAGVVQVEIVGTSGWATRRNPNRTYTLPEQWYAGGFPDWLLTELARFARFMHDEWGVPYALPPQGFGDWRNGRRFTGEQFVAFEGHLGHGNAPENDHTDPGLLDVAKILTFAQTEWGPSGTPLPTTSSTSERTFTMAELTEAQLRSIIRQETNAAILQNARNFKTWPWRATFGKDTAGKPVEAMHRIAAMIKKG